MKIKTVVDHRGFVSYWAEDNYPLVSISGAISASEYIGLPFLQITGVWTGSLYITGSVYVSDTISASNYIGIQVGQGTNIGDFNATRSIHVPCAYAGGGFSAPGQGPQVEVYGPLITAIFDVDNTNDRGYKIVKIPSDYIDGGSFHVHWTKSGNANESGRSAKWRIVYAVYDGKSQSPDGLTQSVVFEQPYLDTGTTARVVYRTHDMAANGFQPGYYIAMYVEAISPTGSALQNSPALVAVDMLYKATINKGN